MKADRLTGTGEVVRAGARGLRQTLVLASPANVRGTE